MRHFKFTITRQDQLERCERARLHVSFHECQFHAATMSAFRPLSIFRPYLLLLIAVFATALSAAETAPAAPAQKLFAVTFTTGPGWDAARSPNDQKFMREHSANLARMRAAGVAVLGGRYADKGLLLVRGVDEAAVRAELAHDPAIAAGTFRAAVDEYRPFQHGDTRPAAASPEITVVRAALSAYNARDADAVAAHHADDIAWFGIGPDGRPSLEGEGREAVRKWLTGCFKSQPDVRAEIFDVTQTGPHVSFRERVSWTANDGARRIQSAIGVYEVRDGKIKRAWYFPAARESAFPSPAK